MPQAPGGLTQSASAPTAWVRTAAGSAQAPCLAECMVGGDRHYLTFDGRSFSFRRSPGCRSSLVQDFAKGQLLIALEHGACDSGSCLHAISVSLVDTHVQLRDSGSLSSQQPSGLCFRP
ncbi:SCO-spondin-like [Hipposideros larvatus]